MSKPANIRDNIKSLKESLALRDVLVKTHLRYLDRDHFDERVAKQQAIIDEAATVIRKIRKQRDDAIMEIGKIEQNQRYDKRKLIKLENYEKIELLKKLDGLLRKETTDGEEHNNTSTPRQDSVERER